MSVSNFEVYSTKFVTAHRVGDQIITDKGERRRWKKCFVKQISKARDYLTAGCVGKVTKASVEEWLTELQSECWQRDRNVLVKRRLK